MKKGLLGLIGVVLIIGCVFVGCKTDSDDNSGGGVELSGGWKGGTSGQYLYFQGNGYQVRTSDGSTVYNQGTYTATATEINFSVASGTHANATCKVSYTKTDTTLTLTWKSGSGFDGLGIAGTYAIQAGQ